jgi:hypothetical protein
MRAKWILVAAMVVGCGGSKNGQESVAPPGQVQLTISIQGAGLVRGEGFECRGSCTKTFTPGMQTRLEAIPDRGTIFAGWSGACGGYVPCDLKLDVNLSVNARFDPQPPPPPGKAALTVLLDGHGSVRSSPAGIDCGGACTATFDIGTSIALAATPDSGWSFAGWSDACSGPGGCALTLNGETRVTAKFTGPPPPPAVTTLAPSDGTNIGIFALNSTRVFFVRSGYNIYGIWSVPKGGGASSLVASTCCAYYLVADDQFVYWNDWRYIYRVAVGGGAIQQLYTAPSSIGRIALDGGNLYWTTYAVSGNVAGTVSTGPAGGGSPTVIATANPLGSLAVDATHVYWTNRDSNGGGIFRVSKGGGAVDATIQCGACIPVVVRVDFQNIYYRNHDSDVWARAKAGGDGRLLSTGNPRSAGSFAVDLDVNASIAYWMFNDNSQSPHGLFRANADGSGWSAIESSADTTWVGPRVDDTAIYYFHAGALLRRAK